MGGLAWLTPAMSASPCGWRRWPAEVGVTSSIWTGAGWTHCGWTHCGCPAGLPTRTPRPVPARKKLTAGPVPPGPQGPGTPEVAASTATAHTTHHITDAVDVDILPGGPKQPNDGAQLWQAIEPCGGNAVAAG